MVMMMRIFYDVTVYCKTSYKKLVKNDENKSKENREKILLGKIKDDMQKKNVP